jgi:dihydrofolate reductase
MIRLTAVVAMTGSRVIGRDGTLPWHLPEDLAFFKRTTLGHAVVMGRKTYESIGRPLPKRRNIVLTRDRNWSAPGVEVIHDPGDLDRLPGLEGRVYVIGGSEIYAALLGRTDELLVSHVFAEHEGDTWFPEFAEEFPVVELVERGELFEVRRHMRAAAP